MQHSDKIVGYSGIFFTILFALISQIIVKWQINLAGEFPSDTSGRIWFLINMLIKPWIVISIIATLFSGLSWMVAMSKFDISYAYPYVSLVYLFMMIAGVVFFKESINNYKVAGTIVILVGVLIVSKGN